MITALTTIAPDADPSFAGWSDIEIERAVWARWGEDSDSYRALRAEQRRRDGIHDARANAQLVLP